VGTGLLHKYELDYIAAIMAIVSRCTARADGWFAAALKNAQNRGGR